MSDYEWKQVSRSIEIEPGEVADQWAHFWTVRRLEMLDDMNNSSGITAFARGYGKRDAAAKRPVLNAHMKEHFKTCETCWQEEASRLASAHREAVLMRVIER